MTYRFSRKAAEDFEDIYVYGASAFGVAQAERYAAELIDTLALLAEFPQAARARPELGPDTRAHPFRAHVIFHRQDGNRIIIQRIRSAWEDWLTHPGLE